MLCHAVGSRVGEALNVTILYCKDDVPLQILLPKFKQVSLDEEVRV